MKYNIILKFEVDGIVDRPDVIGAVFGQTENLFGEDMDLRELQEKGRIGRMVVNLSVKNGRTEGEVIIPSNVDRIETALLAAMVESVDKVGPYPAKFSLVKIEDIREEKKKKIIERAKEILSVWGKEETLDLKEVINEIVSSIKVGEIIQYGPDRLPAGPDVERDPNLIIVEGRADVINLLRYGYKNTIAVEGAQGRIPETVKELSKQKKIVIAFLDGDHGGDLILREMLAQGVKIDYVARAPPGKEVEELTKKEVVKALQDMVPLAQYLKRLKEAKPVQIEKEEPVSPAQAQVQVLEEVQQSKTVAPQVAKEILVKIPQQVLEKIKSLSGTLEGFFYDENWNEVASVQVREIVSKLENLEKDKVAYIVFDGVITQRLVDLAASKNVKILIGSRIGGVTKKPENVELLTITDLLTA
ncbi:MAG: DNA primase DnaG [Thermoprotei archaeon]